MTRFKRAAGSRAFTLIELLIVVAIIAILAAIAVPNFLEAQVRAKVSRAASDMRTIRTALESYRVDSNKYPETDLGVEDLNQTGVGMFRLTTPVAYITSVPQSPFQEENMGFAGQPKNANKFGLYLYVRAAVPNSPLVQDNSPADGLDDDYNRDRAFYLGQDNLARRIQERSRGFWMMKSVGPDNEDDINVRGQLARVYDPTNGTVSAGDLVIFNDQSSFATP